jgi:hypothetical protein
MSQEITVNDGIPVTETGLKSTLGGYAESGELFLTAQITGAEADRVREQMRCQAGLVTGYSRLGFGQPERLDPPVYFEPLPTDEVWKFTTSSKSWQYLAGRTGYALVRDGVVICNTTTAMT